MCWRRGHSIACIYQPNLKDFRNQSVRTTYTESIQRQYTEGVYRGSIQREYTEGVLRYLELSFFEVPTDRPLVYVSLGPPPACWRCPESLKVREVRSVRECWLSEKSSSVELCMYVCMYVCVCVWM